MTVCIGGGERPGGKPGRGPVGDPSGGRGPAPRPPEPASYRPRPRAQPARSPRTRMRPPRSADDGDGRGIGMRDAECGMRGAGCRPAEWSGRGPRAGGRGPGARGTVRCGDRSPGGEGPRAVRRGRALGLPGGQGLGLPGGQGLGLPGGQGLGLPGWPAPPRGSLPGCGFTRGTYGCSARVRPEDRVRVTALRRKGVGAGRVRRCCRGCGSRADAAGRRRPRRRRPERAGRRAGPVR